MNTALPRERVKFYKNYLTSPDWRARRNARLHHARWCCERCGQRRHLHVHHRTYERLGCERLEDLEVLCLDCHEQTHLAALQDSAQPRLYLKLARDVLRADPFASIADLSDEVKRACAHHGIDYDGPSLHRALGLLTGTRLRPVAPAPPQTLEDLRPISAADAREILARLDLQSAVKTIPAIDQATQAAHEARVRAQAQEVIYRTSHIRPSLAARLEAIFAGEDDEHRR
jgi:hypothetical protein